MSELTELDFDKPLEMVKENKPVEIIYKTFNDRINKLDYCFVGVVGGVNSNELIVIDKYGKDRYRPCSAPAVRNVPKVHKVVTRVYRHGLTGRVFYAVNEHRCTSTDSVRLLATFENEVVI